MSNDWEEVRYPFNKGITPIEPNKVHVINKESPLYGIFSDMTHEELKELFNINKDERKNS